MVRRSRVLDVTHRGRRIWSDGRRNFGFAVPVVQLGQHDFDAARPKGERGEEPGYEAMEAKRTKHDLAASGSKNPLGESARSIRPTGLDVRGSRCLG